MRHPLLYQVNTRIFLYERGRELGRLATLDDVPDAWLDEVAAQGFEWIWWLGVWQTGEASRRISLSEEPLLRGYSEHLPDWGDDDVAGSPFAVRAYDVHADYGGDDALARLRERMAQRGLRLLLDFVPNHTALDHRWVDEHPDFYVPGTEEDTAREPHNYVRLMSKGQSIVLAHGRDPHFPGWTDTLQLNYRHDGCRRAMVRELLRIAERCDGVRCDMAMLLQPAVFQRTWGDRALPVDGSAPVDERFWERAIPEVRVSHPDFTFVAEVYWDMEWELQQEGFDFTYDKRLYDRLRAGQGRRVHEHLTAAPQYQERSLRFLENHDEARAAKAFQPGMHQAAAVITFLAPGMRFFHEGQLQGRREHASIHLRRRLDEAPDGGLRAFYIQLLECLRRPEVHDGSWRLWQPVQAWDDNSTCEQFVTYSWEQGDRVLLVAVNYGDKQGQCFVPLEIPDPAEGLVRFRDLFSGEAHDRHGGDLRYRGLYLDMPGFAYHVFEVAFPFG